MMKFLQPHKNPKNESSFEVICLGINWKT